jgi:endonuclease/exonuclease/phosphatase family metal-dependent hydrolase
MDGGENVRSADKDTVQSYLDGIYDTVYNGDGKSDIYMFQEVDENSSRTYHISERAALGALTNTFALNFNVKFVPYPIPPIGTVKSGLMTSSSYSIESARRVSLPCPFSWPTRTANLKRCLLANYIPLQDSDKYLVVVDLHLEAYDSGEGKVAQTNMLKQFIKAEYDKGNYVIAGGDFNQEFPGALEAYPNTHPDLWSPGTLDDSMIPSGWSFAYDTSSPSCRLLNQPYDPSDTANTQYYVIDGFILSPNVKLETVKTLDEGFKNSDHNPVQIKVTLEK